MRNSRRESGQQEGFTVLELLVTSSIILLILGLLLPAIMSAREAARRLQCTNNLRELGSAVHQYHDAVRKLPAAWNEASDGTTGYGWAVDLLPFLEQADLHGRVVRHLPITAAQNDLPRNTQLPFMRCPSDIAESTFELFPESANPYSNSATITGASDFVAPAIPLVRLPASNYVGVFGTVEADETFPAPQGDGPIVHDRRVRFAELEHGQIHTLIIGERTAAMAPSTWLGVNFHGEDAACRLVGSAVTSPNCVPCDECEFASRHSGGANFVWADGHVDLVCDNVDSHEYQQFAKRRTD